MLHWVVVIASVWKHMIEGSRPPSEILKHGVKGCTWTLQLWHWSSLMWKDLQSSQTVRPIHWLSTRLWSTRDKQLRLLCQTITSTSSCTLVILIQLTVINQSISKSLRVANSMCSPDRLCWFIPHSLRYNLWCIHTGRNRDRNRDSEWMGCKILHYTWTRRGAKTYCRQFSWPQSLFLSRSRFRSVWIHH